MLSRVNAGGVEEHILGNFCDVLPACRLEARLRALDG
jgi:hypothetical protein